MYVGTDAHAQAVCYQRLQPVG